MIEVKNLTKRYGRNKAVDNISFTVSKGEVVGFLGPNGAGKTTTMNIITGYIPATEGEVVVNDRYVSDSPEMIKKDIGYLPDTPPLYGDMLVDEYLNFVCEIKQVKPADRQKMLEEIKQTVAIEDVGKRLIKNLSRGYKQRVGVAQALIGDPKIIILDEPTTGLDPKQIIEMRELIKSLGKKHTVILSSHNLSEVSAVCDRVIIINKGKIVASDTPDKLSSSLTQGHKMLARIKGGEQKILQALQTVPAFKHITPLPCRENGAFDFEIQSGDGVDIREDIFRCAAENNMPILMLKSTDMSLEEIFLQLTTTDETAEEEIERDAEGGVPYEPVTIDETTENGGDN